MPRRKLRLKLRSDVPSAAIGKTSESNENGNGTSISISTSATSTPTSTPQRRRPRTPKKKKGPSVPESGPLKKLEGLLACDSLSYQGWQDDVQEFRSLHAKYYRQNTEEEDPVVANTTMADWVLTSRLEGMQHKQQAHLGNRSHPYLQKLDALLPHLQYSGWPQDYQSALQAHYQHNNDWNRQKALFRLRQRQCLHRGDRSHPRLVELDAVAKTLTYPGHERDVQRCQEWHCSYSDDYIGNNVMGQQFQALRNKQTHWQGGFGTTCSAARQQPLQQLESLRSTLTYEGWQDDVETALSAHLHGCATLQANGQVMDYATALHHVQHKDSLAKGDRSHERLQQLDALVGQTCPQMQSTQTWLQLVQQCENTHLRYADNDWIGNAIWDELIKALKCLSKLDVSTIPSTPSKNKTRKEASSPSSTATAETAITASSSWTSDEDENTLCTGMGSFQSSAL